MINPDLVERLARENKAGKRLTLEGAVRLAKKGGFAHERLLLRTQEDLYGKVYPEISLEVEHDRQSEILARIFAKPFGFSYGEYEKRLPKFPEQPPTYPDLGLMVPLITQAGIHWLEAADLSGIHVFSSLRSRIEEVRSWADNRFVMPSQAFSQWIQDGTKFVGKSQSVVRAELCKEENKEYRARMILDAISLWNTRPDMVREMGLDIVGEAVGSDRFPRLVGWLGLPGLDARVVGADPRYRALLGGSQIRT